MAWKDVHGLIAASLLSLEVVGEKESSGCWEYTEDQSSGKSRQRTRIVEVENLQRQSFIIHFGYSVLSGLYVSCKRHCF